MGFDIYLRGEKTGAQILTDIKKLQEMMYERGEVHLFSQVLKENLKPDEIQPGDHLSIELCFNDNGPDDLAENIRNLAEELGYDYYMEECAESGGTRYYALYDGSKDDNDISYDERQPYALLSELVGEYQNMTGQQIADRIRGLWGEERYFVMVMPDAAQVDE